MAEETEESGGGEEGATQEGSAQEKRPPADEETGLMEGNGAENPSAISHCFTAVQCFLAIPFLFASLFGMLFFWTFFLLLLPIRHCCQCGQGPCLSAMDRWLEKGAKQPLELARWAVS